MPTQRGPGLDASDNSRVGIGAAWCCCQYYSTMHTQEPLMMHTNLKIREGRDILPPPHSDRTGPTPEQVAGNYHLRTASLMT